MAELKEERKKQILKELEFMRRLNEQLSCELESLLEDESKVTQKYVYIIWSTRCNSAHKTVTSHIDAAYASLEEAQANKPKRYGSGHNEVDFKIDEVLIGHKRADEILAGYYSD